MDSLHMANLRRAGDRLAEFHHTDLSEACRRAGFHIAALEAELSAERERREAALRVVHEQARDECLWFRAEIVTKEYLQRALRRLHAVIEGEG